MNQIFDRHGYDENGVPPEQAELSAEHSQALQQRCMRQIFKVIEERMKFGTQDEMLNYCLQARKAFEQRESPDDGA